MAGYFSDNLYDASKSEQAEWWLKEAVRHQEIARREFLRMSEALAMAEKLARVDTVSQGNAVSAMRCKVERE